MEVTSSKELIHKGLLIERTLISKVNVWVKKPGNEVGCEIKFM